jgi:hypothetical protein
MKAGITTPRNVSPSEAMLPILVSMVIIFNKKKDII